MSLLLMNVTETERCAGELSVMVQQLTDQMTRLDSAFQTLAAHWEAPAQHQFSNEVAGLVSNLSVAADNGSHLQRRLHNEINQWIEVAQTFGDGNIGASNSTPPQSVGLGNNGSAPSGVSTGGPDDPTHNVGTGEWWAEFLHPESIKIETLALLLEQLGDASNNRAATREFFRNAGRYLNSATDSRGYVGQFDELYRSLFVNQLPYNGRVAQFLTPANFAIISAASDMAVDLDEGAYGGDWQKIIGVNSVHGAGEYALATNPYGAAALTINALYQLGGRMDHAVSGYLHQFVQDQDMRTILDQGLDRSSEALDRADLRNVTKGLAEVVYEASWLDEMATFNNVVVDNFGDWMQGDRSLSSLNSTFNMIGSELMDENLLQRMFIVDPDAITAAGDTLGAAGDFIDGFVDYRVSQIGLRGNQGVALLDGAVQDMPFVPDSVKSIVHDTATDFMQTNDRIVEEIVDLSDHVRDPLQDAWGGAKSKIGGWF